MRIKTFAVTANQSRRGQEGVGVGKGRVREVRLRGEEGVWTSEVGWGPERG